MKDNFDPAVKTVETITVDGTVILAPSFLEKIYNFNPDTPDVYFHQNWLVRRIFWSRFRAITTMITSCEMPKQSCLDLGGGSGIFLPTLSRLFGQVTLVDLDPSQAMTIRKKLALYNCTIWEADIFDFHCGPFDCIVAADVLEHFKHLDRIILRIKDFIATETVLITSLPTENIYYYLARMLFNEKKPYDHYHSATEVERRLREHGFKNIYSTRLPSPLIPLFSVTAWKLYPVSPKWTI
jgi:2-polyprenyl-3-methyl-5-hydroxy-6-metoxy-1,4-benzoquinol methylase